MLATLTVVTLALVEVARPTGAWPTPVKCDEADPTPDGRIYPEPLLSLTYVGFDEFLCGMALLDETYPDLIELEVLGTSEGGNDVYVVRTTDETIPASQKQGNLYVQNSIHGNETAGREGAFRNIEEMLDPDLMGSLDWVEQVLDDWVIHWTFPNPDGWKSGEPGGTTYARGNVNGTDLNRNYPVKGWISGTPLSEVESVHIDEYLKQVGDWYLGTDNHGQGPDTYAAAGLQIVGQFDYQKSETLARFADGITEAMTEYGVHALLDELGEVTGTDVGPYHWGTLYDMLGYSASGSVIDYYNTPDLLDGFGFATEMTLSNLNELHQNVFVPILTQVHVDSVRAINYTMFQQALDPVAFTYAVDGDVAYVFDPLRVRHDDTNGIGYEGDRDGEYEQQPYDVSRMQFFEDLNLYADNPLTAIRVPDVLSGATELATFDTVILNEDPMPEGDDTEPWFAALEEFVREGGNLVLTDGALPALAELGVVAADDVFVAPHYVGSVETFLDAAHPLNANLRGVASQTYDTVPIGYTFGGNLDSAPNWKVDQAAWEAAGGTTTGVHGDGATIYGEVPLGEGRVRILGALLPNPTEEGYHPFGLLNYAVTYTGYTLLQNMLTWDNPAQVLDVGGGGGPDDDSAQTPTTGGGLAAAALLVLAAGLAVRQRGRWRVWPDARDRPARQDA